MKYRLLGPEGEILLNNLSPEEIKLFETCNTTNETLMFKGQKVRQGKLASDAGIVYLLAVDHEKVSRPRYFKEILYAYSELHTRMPGILSVLSKKPINSGKRLLHNVRELNAKNVQELFELIPEDQLRRSEDQLALVRAEIDKKKDLFAKSILRTIKNNVAIRNEISVFSKVEGGDSRGVKKQRHGARRALLSVLHIFFQDFTERRVRINVADTDLEVYADYESFEVAMFALFDNAVKYVLPDSDINILFSKDKKRVIIEVEMLSLEVSADELPHIYTEGFSGRLPKKLALAGKGFGMAIAKKALQLNNASIVFNSNIAPERAVSINGSTYDVKRIVLEFISVD